MNTYDIKQAAEFLKTSVSTLEEILKTGELVAAKHGQSWCFLEADLIEFHRKRAAAQMEQMRTTGKVITSFSEARKRKAPELPDMDAAA
jgi:excisionase family DNA binding protein